MSMDDKNIRILTNIIVVIFDEKPGLQIRPFIFT